MKQYVVYELPIRHLIDVYGKEILRNRIINMMYSMLLVNAYITDDITIYTDFDGTTIYSILPFTIKTINSKSIDCFNSVILKEPINNHIRVKYNEFIIHDIKNGDSYVNRCDGVSTLNQKFLINELSIDDVHVKLINLMGSTYYRFINRVEVILCSYDRYNKE